MPQFTYTARDDKGNLLKNVMMAENEAIAKAQLSEKGLWVVELAIGEKKSSILDFNLDEVFAKLGGVGLKDLVIFCRQFSVLVNSGVAMMKTLSILSEQTENASFSVILKDIKN